MKKKFVFVVVRTEGLYESHDYPVRAFDNEPVAKAFAHECTTAYQLQRERFLANRARHGEKWWDYDIKKTDRIEARYERQLPDRCSIRDSDMRWSVWEVPMQAAR